jgi:hypothetical protein
MPEKDQFIVADYENRWMSVFEMKGKFVSRFGMGKLQGTFFKLIIYISNFLMVDYTVFSYVCPHFI